MQYPYMTFSDNTEVTHSGVQDNGTVKVYIETPIEGGFKNLTCVLPSYKYDNHGYTGEEVSRWLGFVQDNAHIIMG